MHPHGLWGTQRLGCTWASMARSLQPQTITSSPPVVPFWGTSLRSSAQHAPSGSCAGQRVLGDTFLKRSCPFTAPWASPDSAVVPFSTATPHAPSTARPCRVHWVQGSSRGGLGSGCWHCPLPSRALGKCPGLLSFQMGMICLLQNFQTKHLPHRVERTNPLDSSSHPGWHM